MHGPRRCRLPVRARFPVFFSCWLRDVMFDCIKVDMLFRVALARGGGKCGEERGYVCGFAVGSGRCEAGLKAGVGCLLFRRRRDVYMLPPVVIAVVSTTGDSERRRKEAMILFDGFAFLQPLMLGQQCGKQTYRDSSASVKGRQCTSTVGQCMKISIHL